MPYFQDILVNLFSIKILQERCIKIVFSFFCDPFFLFFCLVVEVTDLHTEQTYCESEVHGVTGTHVLT